VGLTAQRKADEELAPDGRTGDGGPRVVIELAAQYAANGGQGDGAGDEVDDRLVGGVARRVGWLAAFDGDFGKILVDGDAPGATQPEERDREERQERIQDIATLTSKTIAASLLQARPLPGGR
jgi:hypothetical protein